MVSKTQGKVSITLMHKLTRDKTRITEIYDVVIEVGGASEKGNMVLRFMLSYNITGNNRAINRI